MAINPSLKIASIAIGTGGVITGGAVGIYNHVNKSTEGVKEHIKPSPKPPVTTPVVRKVVSEFLKGTELELLAETDDKEQDWKPKWEIFKAANTSEPTGNWEIKNWTTDKNNDTGFDAFKKLCLANGKKEVEENSSFLAEIKKYCTKTTKQSPG